MENLNDYNGLEIEYRDKIKEFFPNLVLNQNVTQVSLGEEPGFQRTINFPISNQQLWDTEYFSSGHHSFIHYTTLDSLFNILNTREIRLYDLNKLNDATEMFYAAQKLNMRFNKLKVKSLKDRHFVLSMCYYDDHVYADNFNLWRLYGKEGNGVGIVFNFENPESLWNEI